nr:unknown [Lotus japonicus]
MEASDSVPRLHTDSSGSEHAASPDVTCDKEVQSEPQWNNELEFKLDDGTFDFQFSFLDDNNMSVDEYQLNQLSPLQDMFMYLEKPF